MPSITTINYAAPPQNYFWRWSHDGDIEWSTSQDTLALQVEVGTLLTALAEGECLPPLGAVLLILSACNQQFSPHREEMKNWLITSQSTPDLTEASKAFMERLDYGLKQIENLPESLRIGLQAKLNLIYALFHQTEELVPAEKAQTILHELSIEAESDWTQFSSDFPVRGRFLSDTKSLFGALATADSEEIATLVQTGVGFPLLKQSDLPELPKAPKEALPLLQDLEQSGGQLRGLSLLAKKVIALISLSRPSGSTTELPIGGVSDISNRGTPDRLLPSELAYDDLLLMTRLAQNESLYFQREHPPESAPLQRLVLLDHGIRFWGLPRLFSLATALGLNEHPDSQRELPPTCYYANGNHFDPLPLAKKPEVQKALKHLPPNLDSVVALRNFLEQLQQNPIEGVPDAFFISNATNLSNPEVCALLTELRIHLKSVGGRLFLLNLDREGNLDFSESLASGKQLLSKGKLDLRELIPEKQKKRKKKFEELEKRLLPQNPDLPDIEFYRHPTPPLLFGCSPIKHRLATSPNRDKAIGMQGRTLYEWDSPESGARLLDLNLPGRNQMPQLTENGRIFVVCTGQEPNESCRVFSYDADNQRQEIEIEKTKHTFPFNSFIAHNCVIIIYSDCAEAISLYTGKRVDYFHFESGNKVLFDGQKLSIYEGETETTTHPFEAELSSHNDNRTSIVHPTKFAFLEKRKLVITENNQHFSLRSKGMAFREIGSSLKLSRPLKFEPSSSHGSWQIFTSQLTDNISLLHDTRGFLHLINEESGKKDAWSILLRKGQTSAWHPEHGLITPNQNLLPKNGIPHSTHPTLNALLSKVCALR